MSNPYRRLAEDRKNYFDTMERHMFSSKQSTKGTGRESVRINDYDAPEAEFLGAKPSLEITYFTHSLTPSLTDCQKV